jgi:hypothetical protein
MDTHIEDEHGAAWTRNPDQAQFNVAGEFTAWIVGTKDPRSAGSAGVSCAGWYVSKDDGSELPFRYARPSEAGDSDEARALIAAVLRSLETLPKKSRINLLTRTKYIADGVNGDMEKWLAADLRKEVSKRRNGWEI